MTAETSIFNEPVTTRLAPCDSDLIKAAVAEETPFGHAKEQTDE